MPHNHTPHTLYPHTSHSIHTRTLPVPHICHTHRTHVPYTHHIHTYHTLHTHTHTTPSYWPLFASQNHTQPKLLRQTWHPLTAEGQLLPLRYPLGLPRWPQERHRYLLHSRPKRMQGTGSWCAVQELPEPRPCSPILNVTHGLLSPCRGQPSLGAGPGVGESPSKMAMPVIAESISGQHCALAQPGCRDE